MQEDSPPTFTPQPRSARTPRSQQTRSDAENTPSSKATRRKSTKAKVSSPIVWDLCDDEVTPIKPDIKRENDATRNLLGIHKIEDDSASDEPVKKRKKESTVPVNLLPPPNAAVTQANSQENGYVLQTESTVQETQQENGVENSTNTLPELSDYEDV